MAAAASQRTAGRRRRGAFAGALPSSSSRPASALARSAFTSKPAAASSRSACSTLTEAAASISASPASSTSWFQRSSGSRGMTGLLLRVLFRAAGGGEDLGHDGLAALGRGVELGDVATAEVGHLPEIGDVLERVVEPEQIHGVALLLEHGAQAVQLRGGVRARVEALLHFDGAIFGGRVDGRQRLAEAVVGGGGLGLGEANLLCLACGHGLFL